MVFLFHTQTRKLLLLLSCDEVLRVSSMQKTSSFTHHKERKLTELLCLSLRLQVQQERDELYRKFVKAIHEVQQKSNFKNLLLEKKLGALADTLEKKEAQLNEVLSASNLDPTALTVVTRKLEVSVTLCGSVSLQPGPHSPHCGHQKTGGFCQLSV